MQPANKCLILIILFNWHSIECFIFSHRNKRNLYFNLDLSEQFTIKWECHIYYDSIYSILIFSLETHRTEDHAISIHLTIFDVWHFWFMPHYSTEIATSNIKFDRWKNWHRDHITTIIEFSFLKHEAFASTFISANQLKYDSMNSNLQTTEFLVLKDWN